MDKKQAEALKQKFVDEKHTLLNADYQYLQNRFAAVEKAIRHFLGPRELDRIRVLYETEMTRRILSHRNFKNEIPIPRCFLTKTRRGGQDRQKIPM